MLLITITWEMEAIFNQIMTKDSFLGVFEDSWPLLAPERRTIFNQNLRLAIFEPLPDVFRYWE